MSTVRDLLHAGDPVRLETPPLDHVRDGIRTRVIRATQVVPPRAVRRPAHAWSLVVFALLSTVVASGVVRSVLSHAVTPVFAAVRFEVRLAEDRPVPGLVVAEERQTGRLIYLHPEAVVDNEDLVSASVVEEAPNRFSIAVDFLPTAVDRLHQATAAHINRPVAILIDGDVVLAPVVRAPIGQSAMITGSYSRSEAERIANGIMRR